MTSTSPSSAAEEIERLHKLQDQWRHHPAEEFAAAKAKALCALESRSRVRGPRRSRARRSSAPPTPDGRRRRRRRRLVVGEPARGGRPHRRAAPHGRRHGRRGPRPHRGTRAPPCTSTAAARGGCATACCGSPTGRRNGCTGSAPTASPVAADAGAAGRPRAALRRRRRVARRRRRCCASRRRTPRDGEVVNTIVRLDADAPVDARGRRRRPRLRVRPALAAGRRRLLLAGVGPPGRCRGTPPGSSSTSPASGRSWPVATARESVVQPHVGARRVALVQRRPHRVLEPVPLDARDRRRDDGRPRPGHRLPALGVRRRRASPSSTAAASPSSYVEDGLDHLAVRAARRHGRAARRCRSP